MGAPNTMESVDDLTFSYRYSYKIIDCSVLQIREYPNIVQLHVSANVHFTIGKVTYHEEYTSCRIIAKDPHPPYASLERVLKYALWEFEKDLSIALMYPIPLCDSSKRSAT